MPARAKMLGDGAIGRQKALRLPRGLEPLHTRLPLPRGPMRILTAVIEISTLPMFHPRKDLALGRAVALELIGDDHARDVLQPLEQLAEKLLGGFLVPATLHQDVEDGILLIHRAPQIMV